MITCQVRSFLLVVLFPLEDVMLVSRSNRENGDVIMDAYGVVRRKSTPALKHLPTRPVLLHFSEEEAEARRCVYLGLVPIMRLV